MLRQDFVLSVRQAAWQALDEQGVACKRPKAPQPETLLPPNRRRRNVLEFLYDLLWPWV
ncbi:MULTISPECIES: hypothetical protein [Serratia]|uniref:hypothetical protein n=1 Tax=Serratia TaxID=613 RepID=UPI001358CB96|nr:MULTISPECIES: hypothetical protein [Serratia]QPT11457.1 hypothetical protein I6G37_13000 [Serratia rubidaea]CAE1146282.1 protein of unknown function [Serratia sp. Tan611]